MQEKEIKALLDKYQKGECTPEEKLQVELWYFQQASNSEWELKESEQEPTRLRILSKLNHRIDQPKNKIVKLWPRIAAAASIILCLSAGGYFLLHKHQAQQTAVNFKNDIAPGGNKAILTLSNGQQIVLNNAPSGKIASQGRTAILLSGKGTVTYQNVAGIRSAERSAELEYNTLTVPIGNHRDMTLSDGTEVSLDAGSSITYPVVFNGKERHVTITGQAYFKVKHDDRQPFFVNAKELTMQDIGTEFNINAYDDEPAVKATLVQGSIKVIPNGSQAAILKPGEQAAVKNNGTAISISNADIAAVTAWKDNDFLLRNQGLKMTMREIARWYNVNIIYENAPEKLRIWADISRSMNLSVILDAIQQTGKVKFRIEGRNVYVSQ